MKGKKLLALLLVLVMTGSVLAGCGASSANQSFEANGAPAAMDMVAEAVEEEVLYSSAESDSGAQENLTDQKFIVRVNISAETEDLDVLLENVDRKIAELEGYIEYQNIHNGSAYASHRYRSASLTIRIPADKLEGFVEQVQGQSNVVSINRSRENVTLTYVATESRMEALETEQTRLLELMEQAETMSDLLEIEARLTEVRSELESVTSQMRVLSNQVDYATVELNIDEVEVYTEVEEQTVWQRIGSGFGKNLKNLRNGLVDFFVWLITYSPQLLILAAIATAVTLLIRRAWKKREKKQILSEKPDEKE